jgi:hypothetical protein
LPCKPAADRAVLAKPYSPSALLALIAERVASAP